MMARSVCIYVALLVIYAGAKMSEALPPPAYPTTLTGQGSNRLQETEIDQLNDSINKYIFYFERRRQRGVNNHIKQTMHVVKLLIVQSWMTLDPEPGLISLPKRKTTQEIKDSIKASLKKIDQTSAFKVKDYVIYYMNALEPYIMTKLESEKNSFKYLEKVFYDEEKVLSDKHDDKTITFFQDTWNGIVDVLNEIRSNIIIHKVSSRMILQSYIANYIPDHDELGKTFTITSSDDTNHEFDTPDSGVGIFNDIAEITNEVDKDIRGRDKIKYEVYYHILNERIKKYLENFEKVAGKTLKNNEELGKAMANVKRLMTHGWIEALKPGQEFFPIKRSENLESAKNEIISELKEENINSPLNDAILLYASDKEQQMEREFNHRKETLTHEYTQKKKSLKSIRETPGNDEEIYQMKDELEELERKINVENDNLVAHRICKLFYLNSYRQNFIPEPQRNTNFRIEPSRINKSRIRAQDFNAPTQIVYRDFFSDYIKMDLE